MDTEHNLASGDKVNLEGRAWDLFNCSSPSGSPQGYETVGWVVSVGYVQVQSCKYLEHLGECSHPNNYRRKKCNVEDVIPGSAMSEA